MSAFMEVPKQDFIIRSLFLRGQVHAWPFVTVFLYRLISYLKVTGTDLRLKTGCSCHEYRHTDGE